MWKKKREIEEEVKAEKNLKKRHYSPSCSKNDYSPPSETSKTSKKSEEDIDDLKVLLALYKDVHKKPEEKWSHDGFEELYPEHKPPHPNTSTGEVSQLSQHKNEKKEKKKRSKKKKKKHKE